MSYIKTPVTIETDHSDEILDADGLTIAVTVGSGETDADAVNAREAALAREIVSAVNAHEALVAALEMALETITIYMAPDNGRLDWYAQHRYLLETIDAALALAQGES